MAWYDIIFLIVGVIAIILSLMQGGKSQGASGAITGGGLNIFVNTKERGAEKVISILTLIVDIAFMTIAILINAMAA